jgi:hypothetical protein
LLVYFYETTQCCIPEGCHLHAHCHEKLKSQNLMFMHTAKYFL